MTLADIPSIREYSLDVLILIGKVLVATSPLGTMAITLPFKLFPFTVVLTYHQFAANHAKQSTSLKVRFEDFENQLIQLYNAGFSLVRFEDWLAGNIVVPPGRRPLILSLDEIDNEALEGLLNRSAASWVAVVAVVVLFD